ncbi:MAG: Flagellar motor switch protein FliN [Candidatus Dichloromethanomonas elyunquensis]|nr:MAG: Flagellar motor switch protein FliN [Candidatus Dichloromethanomonas elyunquensis]
MMGNGMLSQEEIDALLSGAVDSDLSEDSSFFSQEQQISDKISDIEKDAMGEIANISMGTAATTLSQLVRKRVEITTPRVDVTTAKKIFEEYPIPHVLIDVNYKKGIEGSNMLVLSREDGSIIVDLMMGGMGLNPTNNLSEMQISGIAEAMNQMMGSAATSMSTMFNSVVDITPPRVIENEVGDEASFLLKNMNVDEPLVRISFRLIIEGILDSVLIQVLPLPVAKRMASKLMGEMNTKSPSEKAPTKQRPATPNPVEKPGYHNAPPPPPEMKWTPPMEIPVPPMTNQGSSFHHGAQPTFIQPAQFAPLSPTGGTMLPNNLGLIYDVPLQVSVELGKASKTIKDILELGPGSVVELDRLAGEPVDMIVNGKLIAKCEVVVINETFGIRITEIINPNDRIDTLN